MIIRQGDTYSLPATILIDGEPIVIENVDVVEFTFGHIIKIYGTIEGADEEEEPTVGTVTFSEGSFIIPFTQEETFSLDPRNIEYQARIKFIDGDVRGTCIRKGSVFESLSQTIL